MKTRTTPMERSYLVQRLLRPWPGANHFAFGGGLKDGGLSAKAMTLLDPLKFRRAHVVESEDAVPMAGWSWTTVSPSSGTAPCANRRPACSASRWNHDGGDCGGASKGSTGPVPGSGTLLRARPAGGQPDAAARSPRPVRGIVAHSPRRPGAGLGNHGGGCASQDGFVRGRGPVRHSHHDVDPPGREGRDVRPRGPTGFHP
jgi:hypothetical protein